MARTGPARCGFGGDTNHGSDPRPGPKTQPASPPGPPTGQNGPRLPPPHSPSPILSPQAFSYSPGPGPAPPTARFGPGNTNPPPLPSSCSRTAHDVTYVLPQKASFPAPQLGSYLKARARPFPGRKATLVRLRAVERRRAQRAGSGPIPSPAPPEGVSTEGKGWAGRDECGKTVEAGLYGWLRRSKTRDFPVVSYPCCVISLVMVEVVFDH